jgi:hypothetical protein
MADAKGGLTFVLDENSGGLLKVMRMARVVQHQSLTDLQELGIAAGTLDPQLRAKLGGLGSHHVLLTRDGNMLDPIIQRGAWRDAGVTLFLLGKRWGGLPLSELTRRTLGCEIVQCADPRPSIMNTTWKQSEDITHESSTFGRRRSCCTQWERVRFEWRERDEPELVRRQRHEP